jgi:multisubunit Na+/H+ antiporter MnhB subunit
MASLSWRGLRSMRKRMMEKIFFITGVLLGIGAVVLVIGGIIFLWLPDNYWTEFVSQTVQWWWHTGIFLSQLGLSVAGASVVVLIVLAIALDSTR